MSSVSTTGGAIRRRRIAAVRAEKVMELYIANYGGYGRIAEHPEVQLSKSRVQQIVAQKMREVADEVQELKLRMFDMRVLDLLKAKRVAKAITRPCPVCVGVTSELGADPCEACADTGYFYDADTRLKAMDRLLRATDQESRLMGDYVERHQTIPIDLEKVARFAQLGEEELDELLATYAEVPDFILQEDGVMLELEAPRVSSADDSTWVSATTDQRAKQAADAACDPDPVHDRAVEPTEPGPSPPNVERSGREPFLGWPDGRVEPASDFTPPRAPE